MGSVAQQFTATALLLLEHEDRLSLDDRLSEHLDGLPVRADEVTPGQLVRHTSGVPEGIMPHAEQSISLETESTRDEALDALREVETLSFEPGSDWESSNSNHLLLVLVVEEVTGAPLVTTSGAPSSVRWAWTYGPWWAAATSTPTGAPWVVTRSSWRTGTGR